MIKKWYPVVDYTVCEECGLCIENCKMGVYDEEKAPTPVVKNPNNCKNGCHGCANACPKGAISYIGDDGEETTSGCGCEGGCCD